MTAESKILVVEDDPKIRNLLRNLLEDSGYSVIETDNSQETLNLLQTEALSLITLDIQLGPDNGIELLRQIRQGSEVPVILVTGKDDVIDRVVGLEIGADDYITKPFHLREVIARIRAVLRRKAPNLPTAAAEPVGSEPISYCFDDITVSPDRLEVLGRDGQPCELTSGDFALLKIFIERPQRTLSRDQLMDLIGGTQWSPLDRTIDNQVARLRKKVERNPSEPKLIKTVRGIGYMFASAVEKKPV